MGGWSGWSKVEIELGFRDFYPNSIPTGDVSNFFPIPDSGELCEICPFAEKCKHKKGIQHERRIRCNIICHSPCLLISGYNLSNMKQNKHKNISLIVLLQ